jgi:membrane protease YdiL (CAAX protease family)
MHPGEGVGARATWTLRDILVGIILSVLSLLLLGASIAFPAEALLGKDEPKTRALLALTILLWDGSLVLLVNWLARRRGGTASSLGWCPTWENESWSPWRIAAFIAVAYAAFWAVLISYNEVVKQAGFESMLPSQQLPGDFFDSIWVIPILGLSIIVSAPIAEELAFRGFVYGALRRKVNVPVAAVLSGLLFSVAHGQLGLIIPFTLIGAILAIVYERTGSIWMNMGLHCILNLVSFIVLLVLGGKTG